MIKTELQSNNLDLRALLDAINNLPEKAADVTEELVEQDELIEQIILTLEDKAKPDAEKPFAYLHVTYPEGSTLTCTNGFVTLTADTATGEYMFMIPSAGDWSVHCTNGEDAQAILVYIPRENQLKTLRINFNFYIFKSGEGAKVALDGAAEDSQSYAEITTEKIRLGWQSNNRTTAVSTTDKIDLTNYNSLHIEYTCSDLATQTADYSDAFGVSSVKVSTGTVSSNLNIAKMPMSVSSTKRIGSLDISSISGTYYIGACGDGKKEIYNIWLN